MIQSIMKKLFTLFVFLIWMIPPLFAQNDSIRKEILNYENQPSDIINKGRRMLLEKFYTGDHATVRRIIDYLVSLEDNKYLAFYPDEKRMLYYWTGQYGKILKGIETREYLQRDWKNTHDLILPVHDNLGSDVSEMLLNEQSAIKENILLSRDLDDEEKDFLILNLEYLLHSYFKFAVTQAYLNRAANRFLQAWPQSSFNEYIRYYIRFEVEVSNWGYGMDFFSGYGIFTDQLAGKFKNNVPFGVAFEIHYKKLALYLRDYIGFTKTKDSIHFDKATWAPNFKANIFLPEASLGIVAFDSRLLRAVPFAGLAGMDISPPENDRNKYPELDDVGLKFATTYTLGLNLDFKIGRTVSLVSADKVEQSFWFIKLRYAYNRPQFKRVTGDFHNITIGIGGFDRSVKRKY